MTPMFGPTQEQLIQDYTNRPRRHFNVGGMMELYWGLWAGGGAMLAAISHQAPRAWRPAFAIGVIAWQIGLFLLLRVMRRQVIERRTGFVQPRRQLSKVQSAVGLAALILIISFGFRQFPQFFGSAAFLTISNALMYAFVSRLERIWNWAIFASMLGGPVVLQSYGPGSHSLLYIGLIGFLWTLGGAIRLALYLRDTKEVNA